jgi:hypothetical protein
MCQRALHPVHLPCLLLVARFLLSGVYCNRFNCYAQTFVIAYTRKVIQNMTRDSQKAREIFGLEPW